MSWDVWTSDLVMFLENPRASLQNVGGNLLDCMDTQLLSLGRFPSLY